MRVHYLRYSFKVCFPSAVDQEFRWSDVSPNESPYRVGVLQTYAPLIKESQGECNDNDLFETFCWNRPSHADYDDDLDLDLDLRARVQ